MNILNRLSELTSIDSKYWILIVKTLIFWLVLDILKRIFIRVFKKIKNSKKEYQYTQKLRLIISMIKLFVFILLWARYLKGFITIISLNNIFKVIKIRFIFEIDFNGG